MQLPFFDKVTHIFESIILRFTEQGSLKNRLLRGGVWLSVGSFVEQGLRFGRNMILTRLLAPEAFGAMAIVIAVKMAMESITNIGTNKAIIQNPRGDEPRYLNGAWYLTLSRVLGLYGMTFLSAPWIAKFYNNPELGILIRITFLTLILEGALSSKVYVAVKKMDFKKWVYIFHGGGIIGIIAAILTAMVWQNIWALVAGMVVEAAARCILSYIICPFLPRLQFDKTALKALFKYTRGIFGLGFLYFIYMRVDHFVIGKFCSTSDLGLYTMAITLAQTPFQLMAALIGQMAMPAFSEMQHDHARINQAILQVTTMIIYISLPLLLLVMLQGGSILRFVYGTSYSRVAAPFAIIFAAGLLRFCSVPIAELYYALGRPELQRYFTGIRAVLMLLLIVPAVKYWGLIGAAWVGLFSMFIGTIIQFYRLQQLTQLNLRQYVFIFLRALLLSLWVVLIWFVTRGFFPPESLISLLPGILGCLLTYICMTGVYLKFREKGIFLVNQNMD